MLLKFAKSVPYLPDPARSRPHIAAADKERGSANPPHAVPYHCKPWVDGQTVGWTLFYGFLTPITITGQTNGTVEVTNLEMLAQETQQPHIVSPFAQGHFGIGCGYTLQTPPGFVSLVMPATRPPAGLSALTAVIETDWYPRQLFLVFPIPPPGMQIFLDRGMELARVVVIPRPEQGEARPFTADEQAEFNKRQQQYLEEEKTTPTRWTSASGDQFTHLYKQWSARFKSGGEEGSR
ncbi:MAG: hypothetical protein KJ069_07325 [Anaerolineae bacterium]|nr:hypothetical protein [Anaerolineae bacterium]